MGLARRTINRPQPAPIDEVTAATTDEIADLFGFDDVEAGCDDADITQHLDAIWSSMPKNSEQEVKAELFSPDQPPEEPMQLASDSFGEPWIAANSDSYFEAMDWASLVPCPVPSAGDGASTASRAAPKGIVRVNTRPAVLHRLDSPHGHIALDVHAHRFQAHCVTGHEDKLQFPYFQKARGTNFILEAAPGSDRTWPHFLVHAHTWLWEKYNLLP